MKFKLMLHSLCVATLFNLSGCAKVADADSVCSVSGGSCCGIATNNNGQRKINIYQCTNSSDECSQLSTKSNEEVIWPVPVKDIQNVGQCEMSKKTDDCWFPFCQD